MNMTMKAISEVKDRVLTAKMYRAMRVILRILLTRNSVMETGDKTGRTSLGVMVKGKGG
jgi:hypothetical protein